MHVQKRGVIFVPDLRDKAPEDDYNPMHGFPAFSCTPFNKNPLEVVLDANNNDVKRITGSLNTVGNEVGKANVSFLGHGDVNLIYFTYAKNPTWFEGHSEEAFKNRESVFRLTLNLLSNDWYQFLEHAAFNARNNYLSPHYLRMFSDALKEIGLGRNVDDKPRYRLKDHVEMLKDFYSQEGLSQNNIYTRLQPYTPEAHGQFSDLIFGEHNELNTLNLIRHCMYYNGIGYLIHLLFALYGFKNIAYKYNDVVY